MTLSPEDATRLRVTFRTHLECVEEFNALDPEDLDGPPTRADVREAMTELTLYEQKAVQTRTRHRLARLEELFEGEAKSFSEPRASHEDLIPEVVLPRCR